MHRARPEDLKTEAIPALTARLSEAALARLFPVEMVELDPWDEPEPSKGALIRLEGGERVVVIYGRETHTAKILLPEGTDLAAGIDALLSEVKLPASSILWRGDERPAPVSALRRTAPKRKRAPLARAASKRAVSARRRADRRKR